MTTTWGKKEKELRRELAQGSTESIERKRLELTESLSVQRLLGSITLTGITVMYLNYLHRVTNSIPSTLNLQSLTTSPLGDIYV